MTAVVLATTLAALLVNAAALVYYTVADYRSVQLADVRTQAEILGRASAAALAFNDRADAQRNLSTLQARADIESAALYRTDGTLFASYVRSPGAAVPARAGPEGHRISGERLLLFHPVVEKGDALGTAYVEARYRVRERLLAYLGITALVMGGALAAALLISAWLQRAVTAPIREVADAARAVVERRDYTGRAGKSTEDEVGVLADAFNSMLKEVQTREEALRLADRRKDEFLATLAHELRNPLAPVRNAVAILAKRGPLDAELAWSRDVIERQVEQMSRLIDDLLDIARIASGKLRIRKERVALERAIDLALETSRPNLAAAGHRLSVLMPSERLFVEADPTRLAQVFSNLLNNAARYTEGRGNISLSVETQGRHVAVSVEDDGIGFPPEVADRLFKPFSQLTAAHERSHGGLGIGLSLVQGIVELHGGSVEGRSAGPGLGSVFVVRLPLAAANEPRAAQPGRAREPGAPPAGLRVLVADDNRDAADSLQRILVLYGHEVRIAYDGNAAVQLAEEFRPAVAVLDIGMPGANGFEVARTLRERYGREPRLIALTGWGQESDRRRALEAGFDYHLTKPVEPAALHDLLVEAASRK
jgi:signal transduction histidine kinase/CheY-like chemotaxis protein